MGSQFIVTFVEPTHIAFNCSLKRKCIACKGVVHFARNCPTVCFKFQGDHASDSCPNRRGWEQTRRDEDDFQSVASEVADGAADETDPDVMASVVPGTDGGATGSSADGANSSAVDPVSLVLDPSQTPGDSALASALDDDRFSQLDDLQCYPDGSSGAPDNQSVLSGLTQIVQEACDKDETSDSSAVRSSVEVFRTPDVRSARSRSTLASRSTSSSRSSSKK